MTLCTTIPAAPEVRIGCSIGISLFPGDAGDPETLTRLADAAMYKAKQAGRGCYGCHSG